MTQSILPELLRDLELYLDRQATEWQRQPEHDRMTTLPATSDDKVNVRAIILALGRPEQVLTPEHLHAAYQVRVKVLRDEGRLIIIPEN